MDNKSVKICEICGKKSVEICGKILFGDAPFGAFEKSYEVRNFRDGGASCRFEFGDGVGDIFSGAENYFIRFAERGKRFIRETASFEADLICAVRDGGIAGVEHIRRDVLRDEHLTDRKSVV